MAQHNNLGKVGEEIAEKHLIKKGYKILEKNWYHGRNEIDIIAMDGEILVVVEVKTRTSEYFGEPELNVTTAKQKTIVKAAEEYIYEKDFRGETRFDVVGILLDKGKMQINHIIDAFYPTM